MLKNIFKSNTELFRWGPAKMRVFFMSEFITSIFNDFPKHYNEYVWPKTLLIVSEGRFVWINNLEEVEKFGGLVFSKYMLPQVKREFAEEMWLKDRNAVQILGKRIDTLVLEKLSDFEFVSLWKEFEKTVIQFWVHGTVPEFANYGSIPILEQALEEYIPDKSERNVALEVLSAPESLSFYQEEELDLIGATNIYEHQQKYFWLKNSYDSVEILKESFFVERKNNLPKDLKSTVRRYQQEIIQRKESLIKEKSLSDEVVAIASSIAYGVGWQDRRKKDIFQYLHYKDLILSEVGRRYKVPKDLLLNYMAHELTKLIETGNVKEKVVRRDNAAWILEREEATYFAGAEAISLWDEYAHEKVSGSIEQIFGIVASASLPVRGKVKIVLDPRAVNDFNEDDVLVAPMTTPEYIFCMKKASAIVTDAGGLTSHAAIVSRELKKPCIIGTKIATQVLKDGDMVEVDANKGIVKKITE